MLYGLLVRLTELPAEQPSTPWDSVLRNAIIEGHLLHTRNLIDFFLPGVTRRDDILVKDFLREAWTPEVLEADRLTLLKPEIDKRLAHLTRERHIEFDGWRSIIITGDLMELVSQFLTRIREISTHLDPQLSDAVRAQNYFDADYGDQYRSALH